MGGCCAATKYSVTSNAQGFPTRISYDNQDTQFNQQNFNLEVIEPSIVSSKYQRAESYAIGDPQRLFKFTDVQACFKYKDLQHISVPDKNAEVPTETTIKSAHA